MTNVAANAAFDFGTVAKLFPGMKRSCSRPRAEGCPRAESSSESRLATDDFPAPRTLSGLRSRNFRPMLLPNACLEVDQVIFDREQIRRLYDSDR